MATKTTLLGKTHKIKCDAKTSAGKRCSRNAKKAVEDTVEEPFLVFFKRARTEISYYCNQHAEVAQ